MDLQLKERQDQTAAKPGQKDTAKSDAQVQLRGMSYAEGAQKLAPGQEAPAGKPGAAQDDDGGPGTTVIRDEKPDSRLGPPKAAVKIAVQDTEVDENQTATLKVEAKDPDAPGKTNQLWFNWEHTGGPAWEKPSGTYKPEMSFTAPEVEADETLTGEVSVAKRGYMKVRGVTTKKPFTVKVKEVAKEAEEEKPEEEEQEEQQAEAPAPTPTPAPAEPEKPAEKPAPDLSGIEAMLAAILAAQNKPEAPAPEAPKAEEPEAPAPTPEAETPKATEPAAPTPTPVEEPAAPVVAPTPAPVHVHHHHHHHHHRRRPGRRHRRRMRRLLRRRRRMMRRMRNRRHLRRHRHILHRRHLRHRHHRRPMRHLRRHRHHFLHRRRLRMLQIRRRRLLMHRRYMRMLRRRMLLMRMRRRRHIPFMHHHHHPHHPVMPPIVRPPVIPKPKLKPKVTAPAAKSLQSGERGKMAAQVVDPDQGKSGGPQVSWRQQKGAKLENVVDQGNGHVEFTAPKVSQKATLTGIVHATDADGLTDQAPFTITVEPAVAANEKALAWGDPHFVGGDGGKYDIMGRPGGTYNLLSDTGVRVTGLMKRYNREGITVFDQAGVTLTGKGAKGITRNNVHYTPGKGATIDGKALGAGKMMPLADGGSALYIGGNLHVDTREGYKVTFLARKAGNGIQYLDVEIKTGARGVGSGDQPDGLMGQTFDADKAAKHGKKGVNAQGEGAIAGVVTDYETKGLFGAGAGKHAQKGLDAATDARRLIRKTVLVNANPGLGAYGYVDSGIQVEAGDTVMISASGKAGENRHLNRTPDGDARYTHPRKSAFMAPGAPAFALVGRVSGEKTGFMVGSNYKGGVQKGGKLELAFNDLAGTFGDNVGYYLADVQVTKGVA